jgi:trigger factor
VQLDVEVDQERVDKQFEAAYKRLAPNARIPGFRPGKAPRQLVERHLGRDRIMAEALDKLVPDVYNEVIEAETVDAVAQPTLSKVDLDPVRLTFTVPVRPTVELGDYTAIRVEREPVEVTEAEVDEQILAIRRARATRATVERPAQWDDLLVAGVRAVAEGDDEFLNDDQVEFPLREGREIVMPGVAEAMIGMKPGETKQFEVDVPGEFGLERVRGKKATFTVDLREVKELALPAEDDELARAVDADEFPTMAALRERIRTDMQKGREEAEEQRFRSAAIDKLVEGATIEFPEVMVEHEIDHVIRDVTGTEASQYAAQLQKIGRSEAEFRAQFHDAGVARLKRGLALARLTELESIEATSDDVDAEIDRLVAPMGEEDAAKFREVFNSIEGIESVKRSVVSQRTLERLATIAGGEAATGAKKASRKSKAVEDPE